MRSEPIIEWTSKIIHRLLKLLLPLIPFLTLFFKSLFHFFLIFFWWLRVLNIVYTCNCVFRSWLRCVSWACIGWFCIRWFCILLACAGTDDPCLSLIFSLILISVNKWITIALSLCQISISNFRIISNKFINFFLSIVKFGHIKGSQFALTTKKWQNNEGSPLIILIFVLFGRVSWFLRSVSCWFWSICIIGSCSASCRLWGRITSNRSYGYWGRSVLKMDRLTN